MFPPSCFHPSITTLALVATASTLLATGCGGAGGDGKADDSLSAEGSSPGECSDGADNDEDGDYDCDDSDCFGAPDCADDDPGDTGSTGPVDADGDGFSAAEDCDDDDPTVPADDADCDGVATADDCDDSDPDRYPGAPEADVGLLEDPACDGGGGMLSLADFTFIAENPGDRAGISVSTAGDVDGDGLDDLFVGASGNDDGGGAAGKAYLVLGKTLATAPDGLLALANADFSFPGERRDNRCGRSVSGAGDLDGDGAPELILSCEDATDEKLGVFYLRRDPSQPWTSQCDPIDVAGQDGAKFDLVRVADVDGDGAADIVTSEEGLGEDVGLGVVWYRNPGT